MQGIDQLPSPQAGVRIEQTVSRMQHVVRCELLGQAVAPFHQREPLLVPTFDIQISEGYPEEGERPLATVDDAVDERLFLSCEVDGPGIVAMGAGEPAKRARRENLEVDITQFAADAQCFLPGLHALGHWNGVDLSRISLSRTCVGA